MVFTMAGQCVQNNEGIEETNRRNATNPFTKSLRSLTFTKHCFNVSTCNLDLPQKKGENRIRFTLTLLNFGVEIANTSRK